MKNRFKNYKYKYLFPPGHSSWLEETAAEAFEAIVFISDVIIIFIIIRIASIKWVVKWVIRIIIINSILCYSFKLKALILYFPVHLQFYFLLLHHYPRHWHAAATIANFNVHSHFRTHLLPLNLRIHLTLPNLHLFHYFLHCRSHLVGNILLINHYQCRHRAANFLSIRLSGL